MDRGDITITLGTVIAYYLFMTSLVHVFTNEQNTFKPSYFKGFPPHLGIGEHYRKWDTTSLLKQQKHER